MKTPVILLVMLAVGVGIPALLAAIFGVVQRAFAKRAMKKPPERVADPGRVTPALIGTVIGAPILLLSILGLALVFRDQRAATVLGLSFYLSAFGILAAWLVHSLPGHKRNAKYALFYLSTQTLSGIMLVGSLSRSGKDEFAIFFGLFFVGGTLFNVICALMCLRLFRPDAPLTDGDETAARALEWYRRVTWFQGSDLESAIVMAFFNVIGLSGVYLMIRWCAKARVGRHSIVYLRSFHYEDAGQVFGGVVTPALFRMAPSTGLVHLTQRHLERALAVVLDVSVMSQSVEWEVATVRAKLPPERIIVLHRSDVAAPSLPGLNVLAYDASSKDGIMKARLGLAQWAAGALTSAVGSNIAPPVAAERPRYQLPILAFLVLVLGLPISGLLGIALFAMSSYMDRSKVSVARMEIDSIAHAVEMYRIENAQCPPTLAAIDSKYVSNVNADPWGQPYVYRCPGAEEGEVDIISIGPDGELGTEDDLRNRRRGMREY
ncbi:MAG: type II secretion system protein GspG [Archangium sp.]|nr:type II secretion system protein GspG [Archangium sp.]